MKRNVSEDLASHVERIIELREKLGNWADDDRILLRHIDFEHGCISSLMMEMADLWEPEADGSWNLGESWIH